MTHAWYWSLFIIEKKEHAIIIFQAAALSSSRVRLVETADSM